MDDLVTHGWPSIFLGITLAGGAYPAVIATVYFAVGFVFIVLGSGSLSPPIHVQLLVGVFLGSLAFAAIGGAIGIFLSAIVALLTLPVVHAVVWSMKLRTNLIRLGAFSGGLVAFVAFLLAAMLFPKLFGTGEAWWNAILLIIGPALATVVGQIGGALGGRHGTERIAIGRMAPKIELMRLRFAMKSPTANEQDVAAATQEDQQEASRFQFRTIHLLWVGVWVSLLLTLIRLSGIPFELMLPLLLGWVAFQALSLWLGKHLVHRFGPWWRGE